MTKQMVMLCEELKLKLKAELREIKETIEIKNRKLRRDLKEVRSTMKCLKKVFEEMKDKLDVGMAENVELTKKNPAA